MREDEKPYRFKEHGLKASVEAQNGTTRVAVCLACGMASPALPAGDEVSWFEAHAREKLPDHEQARQELPDDTKGPEP